MRTNICFIVLCLGLLVVGCATTQPTLEDLMRESYDVGCKEGRFTAIVPFDNSNADKIQEAIAVCHERSMSFRPEQVGIYDNEMKIYHHKTRVDR